MLPLYLFLENLEAFTPEEWEAVGRDHEEGHLSLSYNSTFDEQEGNDAWEEAVAEALQEVEEHDLWSTPIAQAYGPDSDSPAYEATLEAALALVFPEFERVLLEPFEGRGVLPGES